MSAISILIICLIPTETSEQSVEIENDNHIVTLAHLMCVGLGWRVAGDVECVAGRLRQLHARPLRQLGHQGESPRGTQVHARPVHLLRVETLFAQ